MGDGGGAFRVRRSLEANAHGWPGQAPAEFFFLFLWRTEACKLAWELCHTIGGALSAVIAVAAVLALLVALASLRALTAIVASKRMCDSGHRRPTAIFDELAPSGR